MNLPVGIEDIKRASAAFLARPHGVFINGDWADATTGELIDIIDPASGGVIAQVQAAGAQDVDQAVRAARVAFDDGPWADLAAPERARFMMKLAEAVERAGAEIAYLETLDNGMPLIDASIARAKNMGVDLDFEVKLEGDESWLQRFSHFREARLNAFDENFAMTLTLSQIEPV